MVVSLDAENTRTDHSPNIDLDHHNFSTNSTTSLTSFGRFAQRYVVDPIGVMRQWHLIVAVNVGRRSWGQVFVDSDDGVTSGREESTRGSRAARVVVVIEKDTVDARSIQLLEWLAYNERKLLVGQNRTESVKNGVNW